MQILQNPDFTTALKEYITPDAISEIEQLFHDERAFRVINRLHTLFPLLYSYVEMNRYHYYELKSLTQKVLLIIVRQLYYFEKLKGVEIDFFDYLYEIVGYPEIARFLSINTALTVEKYLRDISSETYLKQAKNSL